MSERMSDRESRISAAGVVQSVIASGAPIEEWPARAMYGLNLVKTIATRLQGDERPLPAIPKSLRGGS